MRAPTKTDVLDIAIEFVGSKKYEYVATIAGASSQAEGKTRVLAFLQKAQTSQTSNAIYLQVDAKYKTVAEHQQNENDDRPHADLKFILSCALENNLELATLRGNIELKQSRQMKEEARAKYGKQTEQRNHAIDHIDVELDLTDVHMDVLEKKLSLKAADVYNYIRYATYQHLNEDNEHKGQQNKMAFEVRLLDDMSSANITMKAANLKSEWKGVPVPKTWRNIIAVPSSQSSYSLMEEATRKAIQYQDTCQIKSNQLTTFGNATIKNVDYDNTWHVAVQHQRRNQPVEWNQRNQAQAKKSNEFVSIAVRNIETDNDNQEWPRQNQNGNKHIEVAIVVRRNANDEVLINLRPGNQQSKNAPRLLVNGQQHQMSESKVQNIYSNKNQREWLARVYMVKRNTLDQSDVDIKVETAFGDYQITYNGKEAQIYRDSFFRGNHGICGSYTGQRYNELKSPQNQLMHNTAEFVASWALITDEQAHKAMHRFQQKTRNTENPSEEIMYSNPIPSPKRAQKPMHQEPNQYDGEDKQRNAQNQQKQQPRNQDMSSQSTTKHQTQYVEDQQSGRICFSKRPLPVCAPGTNANGKYIQKVEVTCRSINDPAAQQYKSQIRRGRNLDMSAHKTDDELKFNVPKRCEQL